MPRINADDLPVQFWMQFIRNNMRRDDRIKCIDGIIGISRQIEKLETNDDDRVVCGSVVLRKELEDLCEALATWKLTCNEAYLILDARLETFVSDSLEQWVLENYGPECVYSTFKMTMGKS